MQFNRKSPIANRQSQIVNRLIAEYSSLMRILDGPDRKALGTAGTPAVDLMLVVLILAGVFQAGKLAVRAARPDATPVPAGVDSIPAPQQIVLTLRNDGALLVNGFGIDPRGLEGRLRRIYRDRPVKLLFLEAGPDRTFGEVQNAVRAAYAAGVEQVGYLPVR